MHWTYPRPARLLPALAFSCVPLSAAPAPLQTFDGLLRIGDDPGETIVGEDLDIDGNGTPDVNVFYDGGTFGEFFSRVETRARAPVNSPATRILARTDAGPASEAARLQPGSLVGGDPTLVAVPEATLAFEDLDAGPFGGQEEIRGEFIEDGSINEGLRGVLGVAFEIDGATHYGWLEVELDNRFNRSAGFVNVYGYGYETNAHAPVVAGSDGTAPGASVPLPGQLIAAIAVALVGWRRSRPWQADRARLFGGFRRLGHDIRR